MIKAIYFQPLAILKSKLNILNGLVKVKCHLNVSEGLCCVVHDSQTG